MITKVLIFCLTCSFSSAGLADDVSVPITNSLCSVLSRGGVCVSKRQPCPQNHYEVEGFSNIFGCGTVTQKCCGGDFTRPIINRQGVVLPQSRNCGMGSGLGDRILNGRVSGSCDWPFVVSIRARLDQRSQDDLTYGNTTHHCAGVLVANRWVLTSPYCVLTAATTAADAPNRLLIVAADYNTDIRDVHPTSGQYQEQLIRVEQAFINPFYAYSDSRDIFPTRENLVNINGNGVALLKLAEPINGQCSGVACLPTVEEANNDCASYDTCRISGWGLYRANISADSVRGELLIGDVRLSSRRACDFLAQRLQLTNTRFDGSVCTMPAGSTATDTCLGDEGGAVLCFNGFSWVVRGIIPFNLCSAGSYNLFVTDVAPYNQWIESVISTNN